jgi:hypothetical protein
MISLTEDLKTAVSNAVSLAIYAGGSERDIAESVIAVLTSADGEERRAEPTLDDLLATARERWGDGFEVAFLVDQDGYTLTICVDDDDVLADATADTAIGALAAAVEGR